MTFYSIQHTNNNIQKLISVIDKQITITSELEIGFYVLNNYEIKYDDIGLDTKLTFPLIIKDFEKLIENFNKKVICYGGPNASNFPGNGTYLLNVFCNSLGNLKKIYSIFCLRHKS